jgi:hypothetical protein
MHVFKEYMNKEGIMILIDKGSFGNIITGK